jgi:acyl-CoA thioester hydrolase
VKENLMTENFSWPVRVYYEDTDAGGIVYHARYLQFLERARTEWLRNLGFNQSELKQEGVVFVVRDMQINWQSPALLDEALQVNVQVHKVKKASFIMTQQILLGNEQKLKASVTIACLNSQTLKPLAIPLNIIAAMNLQGSKGVTSE